MPAAQDLNRQGRQPAQMVTPVRIFSNGHQFGVLMTPAVPRTNGIVGFRIGRRSDAQFRS